MNGVGKLAKGIIHIATSTYAFAALVIVSAMTAWGDLTGLTTISDVSELEAMEGDVTLGRGTLRYTGASGTVNKNITIAPSGGNLDATIDVTNENTILTISGNVATQSSNSRFIKKGRGTLRLSGTGAGQRLGYGTDRVSGRTTWDASGYATAGASPFTLVEGRLLVDGAGSTFTLGSSATGVSVIGGLNTGIPASPMLEVSNGASVTIPFESFYLYGNGTEAARQDATIYVHDGGSVTCSSELRFRNFMGNDQGFVIVDGGTFSVNRLYCPNCSASGAPYICVTNRGLFSQTDLKDGYENTGTKLTMDITHFATGMLSRVNLDSVASSIRVREHGVLKSDRSIAGSSGTFLFDGGTWGSRRTLISTWGGTSAKLSVGVNGMSLHTDGIAYLFPVPSAVEGEEASAALSKIGAGTVTLRPRTTLPLTVREGFVSFPDPMPLFAASNGTETVTVKSGAGVIANGEGTWNGKLLTLEDGAKLVFAPRGARNDLENWTVPLGGRRLTDGTVIPADMNANSYVYGAAWANQRLRVDRSFTLAFETSGAGGSASLDRALLYAVFHNSPSGTAAVGAGGDSVGLAGTIKNGFAIGAKFSGNQFTYGANKSSTDKSVIWKADDGSFDVARADVLGSPDAPTSWRVAYDHGASTMALKFRTAKGDEKTYTKSSVNLVSYCGTNEVFFGFVQGIQSGTMGIQIANLREVGEDARGVVQTGGDVTIPAGTEVAAEIHPTEFANGFTAKSLAYGDGSTLAVSTNGGQVASAPYVAFETMAGSGTLVKKGKGSLGFQRPPTSGVPRLRIDEGGLVLRKEPLETLAADEVGGWSFKQNAGGMGYLSSTNIWMKTTGFQVGSGTALANDGVNSRRRVYVAGNWRIHFKAAALARTSAEGLYMTLHDKGSDVSFPSGTDRYVMRWYVYEGYSSAIQRMNTASVGSVLENVDNKSSYAPINFCTALPANGGAGLVDVTIEHDAELKRVRCIMAQGENCVTNDFANQIVAPVSGGGYAYVGFTAYTGSASLKMEVTDFSFEQLNDADPLAASPYVSEVEIGANAGTVTLDSPVADGVFKLADSVTIASGATVRTESCGKAAILDIGTPVCAGDTLALAGDANSTIRVASMPTGVSRITVDGGVFETSGSFGAHGAELSLSGDAKVSALGRVSFRSITVDGVKQSSGVYTAENCSFVRGAGSLSVGLGTIIIVR